MKELWQLFIIFCRIGGFTFGGGYAMLPMMQKEIVEKRNWATDQEMLDYYAIGQSTPGIIAVNTATFIGYKRKGIIGAIIATAGMVFPSLVIITLIAAFFRNFQDYRIVKHAFAGIRVAVVVLILNAIIKMWKNSVKDWKGIIVFCTAFAVTAFTDISPIIIIVISAAIGIIINIKRIEAK
jgi:chromate transporter